MGLQRDLRLTHSLGSSAQPWSYAAGFLMSCVGDSKLYVHKIWIIRAECIMALLELRSLKTVHKSAPPMPRLRFPIQLASSDPRRIVYLVAVDEIYPG
jgi:hypothetical protein